jgi:hypothetical protein
MEELKILKSKGEKSVNLIGEQRSMEQQELTIPNNFGMLT